MGLRNGGSICTKTFIDLFGELSDEITIMTAAVLNFAFDLSRYKIIQVPPSSLFNRICKIFFGAPHRYVSYLEKNMGILDGIDTVVLSGSILGSGIIPLIEKRGVKIITIHHNYEPRFHKDNKTLVTLKGLNIRRIFKAEDLSLRKSDLNISLTEADKMELLKHHNNVNSNKIIIIPAILDKEFKLPNLVPIQKGKIVISGALSDYQTYDGIKDFVQNYIKQISDLIPHFNLIIAGRNPSKSLLNYLARYGIAIIPNPKNFDDILATADIYINPTKLGSGIKLRNIDSLKWGVPIIGHHNACIGYEPLLGTGIFEYSDSNSFRLAALSVLRSVNSRKTIQEDFYNSFSFNKMLSSLKKELTIRSLL